MCVFLLASIWLHSSSPSPRTIVCEILAGAMTGGYTIEPSHPRDPSIIVNSMTSLIFDPALFARGHGSGSGSGSGSRSGSGSGSGLAAAHAELQRLVAYVTASPLRPGASPGTRIIVPGQYERDIMAKREKSGIPVAAGTYDQLRDAAVKVGIEEAAFHATMKGSK